MSKQDNDSKHILQYTMNFFKKHKPYFLECPNLNMIENMWVNAS